MAACGFGASLTVFYAPQGEDSGEQKARKDYSKRVAIPLLENGEATVILVISFISFLSRLLKQRSGALCRLPLSDSPNFSAE
jgi:hypothetical protein